LTEANANGIKAGDDHDGRNELSGIRLGVTLSLDTASRDEEKV
jgi:hypothetical protein